MKTKGIIKNFISIMLALSIFIVILWLIFYLIEMRLTERNMITMAENASETILESVEKELLRIEDTAYDLAHADAIKEMAQTDDTVSFYEAGASAAKGGEFLLSGAGLAGNAVVFKNDGSFFRLNGTISNTALKRAFQLISQSPEEIVTVTYNDQTYIGSSKAIPEKTGSSGYVAIFVDNVFIENLLGAYRDIDYLGIALFSGEKLIASNHDEELFDTEQLRESAAFLKEKEIGFTGFRLLVYCEDSVSEQLGFSFAMTFLVVAALLIFIIIIFGRTEQREKELYSSKMKLKEADVEKERTLVNLLKKQISAHFTVNTLNVVRALVNKGDRTAAAKLCDELSTMLRYANAGDELISLMDELYVLEQYIGIMQVRYPGKIDAQFDEDDSYGQYFIPRMLVQPVLENAIIHGLGDRPGKVRVFAIITAKEVCVCVRDNGKGMTKEELHAVRESLEKGLSPELSDLEHVALNNVQKRIRMICGEKYGIEIDSVFGKGCEVMLHFPKITEEESS